MLRQQTLDNISI